MQCYKFKTDQEQDLRRFEKLQKSMWKKVANALNLEEPEGFFHPTLSLIRDCVSFAQWSCPCAALAPHGGKGAAKDAGKNQGKGATQSAAGTQVTPATAAATSTQVGSPSLTAESSSSAPAGAAQTQGKQGGKPQQQQPQPPQKKKKGGR